MFFWLDVFYYMNYGYYVIRHTCIVIITKFINVISLCVLRENKRTFGFLGDYCDGQKFYYSILTLFNIPKIYNLCFILIM